MTYIIKLTSKAEQDLQVHIRSGNKLLLQKITALFAELQEHPRFGTGQIEKLRYYDEEIWSRRINREHRIVYRIQDKIVTITVISAYGHYK
jgi:toxin YoeB